MNAFPLQLCLLVIPIHLGLLQGGAGLLASLAGLFQFPLDTLTLGFALSQSLLQITQALLGLVQQTSQFLLAFLQLLLQIGQRLTLFLFTGLGLAARLLQLINTLLPFLLALLQVGRGRIALGFGTVHLRFVLLQLILQLLTLACQLLAVGLQLLQLGLDLLDGLGLISGFGGSAVQLLAELIALLVQTLDFGTPAIVADANLITAPLGRQQALPEGLAFVFALLLAPLGVGQALFQFGNALGALGQTLVPLTQCFQQFAARLLQLIELRPHALQLVLLGTGQLFELGHGPIEIATQLLAIGFGQL